MFINCNILFFEKYLGSGSGDFNSQLELGEAGFSVKKSDVNIHNKK